MMIFLFWVMLIIILYAYAFFPILVFLYGLIHRSSHQNAEITPTVSLIIAAHNEAKNIKAKLENLLSLDYPKEKLEVVVASDGSDDDTVSIVRSYTQRGVRLLPLPRQGKANALNAAVAQSSGEILVFSDANSIYRPDALRALVRPFADDQIGGVAGNQCYLPKVKNAGATSDGERSYWNFDRFLKRSESQAGNVISATGAIYAIRRQLFHPVLEGVTDDFYTSTGVILDGYRLVYEDNAVAYEPAAFSSEAEFSRKVRIITRGLQAVIERYPLLNPFRFGFYSVQLFSHKILRRLVFFPFLGILLISPFLWSFSLFYKIFVLAELVLYGCALAGFLLRKTSIGHNKLLSIPFFFVMVNTACLLAVINILRGKKINRWEPQRKTEPGTISIDHTPISQPKEHINT